MTIKQPRIAGRACVAALALPLLASAVRAQAPADPGKEEVLGLPEFTVTAASEADRYSVQDTTSGSRMNIASRDLPYSISSMTSEFMKDFAIVDITDDLSYLSGITGNTDSLTFNVRGYTGGNNALVNGHFRYTPLVAGQIERVELIKGPSGSIYGQTNPGGTLLVSTFQPRATEEESLNVVAGSYNLLSAVAHLTGPIPVVGKSSKLYYEIGLTSLHRTFDNPGIDRREKSVAGTLLWKPDENTSLEVISSWQQYYVPVAGDWALPYTTTTGTNPYTGASLTRYVGFAWWLRHANYASTHDYIMRGSTGFTANLEHRFNDWLSFQSGYDWYHTPAETYNVMGSGGTINLNTGLIGASATPSWSTIYGTGWSYSADLLAHYHFWNTDDQTLVTVDDYLNNRTNYSKTTIAGTFTPGFTSFNPLLPLPQTYLDPQDSAHWTSATTANNAVSSEGFGINHQTVMFDKRLFLYAGYRHDYVQGYQTNPNAALGPVSGTTVSLSGNAHQSFIHDSNDAIHAGVSWAFTKDFSWYASVYQGFQPFGTSVPLTVTIPAGSSAFVTQQLLKTLTPASTTSLGEETGIKSSFRNGDVTIQADVFHTKQKNVSVSELSDPNNPSSPTVNVPEGDQTAQGFELDTEFKLIGSLHGMYNYSYTDSKVENQASMSSPMGGGPAACRIGRRRPG